MGSTTVAPPPIRDIGAETRDTLQAQVDLSPAQLAAYQQTAPGYDEVDLNRMRTALGAAPDANVLDMNRLLTGAANQQTTASNSALRAGDIADVQNMGAAATAAARAANPNAFTAADMVSHAAYSPGNYMPTEQETLLRQRALGDQYSALRGGTISAPTVRDGVDNTGVGIRDQSIKASQLGMGEKMSVNNVYAPGVDAAGQVNAQTASAQGVAPQGQYAVSRQVNAADPSLMSGMNNMRALFAGPTGIENTLQQQAQSELAAGSSLHPEEIRAAQQAARAAAGSRGLGESNSALAQEVLNTYQMGQQRLNQRRDFAGGVNQMFRTGQEADRGFGLNVESSNLAGNAQYLQAQMANQGAQLQTTGMNMQDALSRGTYNAGLGAQMSLANQQANLQGQLANQSTNAQQAQLRAQLAMQGGLANQQAGIQQQQFNIGNQLQRDQYNATAQNQASQTMFDQNMQAQLANQQNAFNRDAMGTQTRLQADQANQQAGLGAQQYNADANMRAQVGNNSLQVQRNADLAAADQAYWARKQQVFNQFLGNAQAQMSMYQDPYMAILGRQSSNVGNNAGLSGMAQQTIGQNAGVRNMFDPMNSYANDLYGSNQSAVYNTNIANANNAAGMWSGLMGGASKIGSSMFGLGGMFGKG